MSERANLRKLALWSNRANDAYAMGEADWVYGPHGNTITRFAAGLYNELGNAGLGLIANQVEKMCRLKGIDPKRHKWHGR